MTRKGVLLVVTHTALLMYLLTSTSWVQAVYFFANAALFALVVNENEKLTDDIRSVRSSYQDCIDSLIDRIQVLENKIKGK